MSCTRRPRTNERVYVMQILDLNFHHSTYYSSELPLGLLSNRGNHPPTDSSQSSTQHYPFFWLPLFSQHHLTGHPPCAVFCQRSVFSDDGLRLMCGRGCELCVCASVRVTWWFQGLDDYAFLLLNIFKAYMFYYYTLRYHLRYVPAFFSRFSLPLNRRYLLTNLHVESNVIPSVHLWYKTCKKFIKTI